MWDEELERAYIEDRTVEVVTVDDGRYVGHFSAAREDAGAEPWIFLVEGYWCKGSGADDWEQPSARGVIIHRDQIRQVTIQSTPAEAARSESTGTAQVVNAESVVEGA